MSVPSAPWRVAVVTRALGIVTFFDEIVREAGHETVGVLTVPSPQGRPPPEPFRGAFLELVEHAPAHLDIVVPSSRERVAPLLRALDPDLVLCMACPWRLPADALAVPRVAAVNGHPSLLPRYRGPQPFAWMIRNAETEAGMTYHRMTPELDAGPILAQGALPVEPEETLFERTRTLSRELLRITLERLARGEEGEPQGEGEYQSFFEPEYVRIDWSRPRDEVHRQVRAWRSATPVGTELGALAELDGETVRVLKSSLEPVEGARRVDCADGPLWIVETEPAQVGDT